ncbi:MAG: low-specificity L-threonine aldolase [Acidimicrobiia bacterium]|nr:low-specificity L-threonine aldolase [Acidimicrobiia bacterium]MDH5504166.1 low-specificity L-threonine aldolase [Acidimicrobiia bacterium]
MIDLRSDTVTQPTEGMRRAMAEAAVGDDVFGDDPTVNALEAKTAELLGKESAVFVPSGTQSNLIALMAHCQRGDEYIVGQLAHTYKYEAGGAAVLGSIQPQPIDMEPNGSLSLDRVASVIKPDDSHFARTRLVCLENTHQGKVVPLEYLRSARAFVDDRGLALHLDGARIWNAAVALGVPPAVVAEPFDSVSVCLSKGLGAPVGSVLVGTASLIAEARRWRKMLGGGMRQAGIIAAAGIYALDHHIDRLAEDHANAQLLAKLLGNVPGVTVKGHDTNMVFVDFGVADYRAFAARLKGHGIVALTGRSSSRLVTHLGVTSADVERFVEVVSDLEPGS